VTSAYLPFYPPRPVREYQSVAGQEPSGLRLPWFVLDSLGRTIPAHLPDEYVVIGERVYDDGRRFLQFAATTEFIEATTSHRYDPEHHRLRLQCQSCLAWDGKHRKGCAG